MFCGARGGQQLKERNEKVLSLTIPCPPLPLTKNKNCKILLKLILKHTIYFWSYLW